MEKGVPVRSISRCLRLLQFINRNGPATLMEIACAISLPYPTTIRIVQTLVHEGMLECLPVRKLYQLTSLVQTLSVGTHEIAHVLQASRPHLVALTQDHGWPASITCGVGAHMMVRDSTCSMTSRVFNLYHSGYTFPMLACAAGHVYLAFASDEVRECLLNGLPADHRTSVALAMFRSGTLTQRILRDGYAISDRTLNTMNPGMTSSIAVPIQDAEQVAGVLSLSFFSSAMPMKEAVARYASDLLLRGRAISKTLESLLPRGPEAPKRFAVNAEIIDGAVAKATQIARPARSSRALKTPVARTESSVNRRVVDTRSDVLARAGRTSP